MSLFYRDKWSGVQSAPVELPHYERAPGDEARNYIADEGLTHAVNTALLLGKPLLVTGEPGTGKTVLAASVALQLNYPEPLVFVAKSTSQAQDLFYSFDALARLKAEGSMDLRPSARSAVDPGAVEYIRYSALGTALLFANERDHVRHLLPRGMAHPGKRHRSVVLIDEIDKAPRDFPNDLLFELEHMAFRIPELNDAVSAEPEMRPVVIITSNSERGLPDAFLRRCIYYDIPFPEQRLDEILQARLAEDYDQHFAGAALELFLRLRSDSVRLSKKPSTAELIGWMIAMVQRMSYEAGGGRSVSPALARNPLLDREMAQKTIGALIKTREDRRQALPVVQQWIDERKDDASRARDR